MTGWLQLTGGQRKATIDQAEQDSGIRAEAIEKDWWVTLVLKALFQSSYAQYMVFKGGTSLSKGWKMVARFSEDIDIALSPEAFGMAYLESPSNTHVKQLKKKGCVFTGTLLKAELEKQIMALGVPQGMVTIEAAEIPAAFPDTDPQVLFVKYPSLYSPNGYIADEVKIEVSVRSLRTPFTNVRIESLLHEINPNPVYAETPFLVAAVEPRKTFLEKTFLLHEEFGKPDKGKIRTERMSRHLYDLGNMMNKGVDSAALNDHALYDTLVAHRKSYSRISWIDYESLNHPTLSFIPPAEVLNIYRDDYQTMQDQMIYEEAIPFDELIRQLKFLQGKFRMKMEPRTLEEVIAKAETQLRQQGWHKDANIVQTPVTYPVNEFLTAGPHNTASIYVISFIPDGDRLHFESIALSV